MAIYCQDVPEEVEIENSTLEVKIKEIEVLAMLKKLQLYEEGQETKNNKLLIEICRYKRQVRGRMNANRPIQQTIDQLFATQTSTLQGDGMEATF
jgi:hypothetical protein